MNTPRHQPRRLSLAATLLGLALGTGPTPAWPKGSAGPTPTCQHDTCRPLHHPPAPTVRTKRN